MSFETKIAKERVRRGILTPAVLLPVPVLFACLALVSCSRRDGEVSIPPMSPAVTRDFPLSLSNVPPIYRPLYEPGLSEEEARAFRRQLPFDSISLRRTACFGECPVYEVILYRDGRAEFNAEGHTPKIGKFVGNVSIYNYGRLCYIIESSRFSEMNTNYHANWTDASTCFVTVKSASSVKTVSDYGGVGPIKLWAIQQLIDSVKDGIKWKPAK